MAKVDVIAFYSAAKMIAEGNTKDIYKHDLEKLTLILVKSESLPDWAPKELTRYRVIANQTFTKTANVAGYDDSNPPMFVYLPLFAIIFLPLQFFSWPAATYLFDVFNLILFSAAIAYMIENLFKIKFKFKIRIFIFSAILLLLSIAFHPMLYQLYTGQITASLMALSIFSVLDFRDKSPKGLPYLQGVVAGFCAAIKLYPILVLLIYLIFKRKKEAISMLVTFGLIFILSFLIFGFQFHVEWRELVNSMLMGDRVWFHNQSLDGFFQRFAYSVNMTNDLFSFSPSPLKPLAVTSKFILLALWIWRLWTIRFDHNSEGLLYSISLTLLLFTILPPICWLHYHLFTIPAFIYLGAKLSGKKSILQWVLIPILFGLFVIIAKEPSWIEPIYQPLINVTGSDWGSFIYRALSGAILLSTLLLFMIMLYNPPHSEKSHNKLEEQKS